MARKSTATKVEMPTLALGSEESLIAWLGTVENGQVNIGGIVFVVEHGTDRNEKAYTQLNAPRKEFSVEAGGVSHAHAVQPTLRFYPRTLNCTLLMKYPSGDTVYTERSERYEIADIELVANDLVDITNGLYAIAEANATEKLANKKFDQNGVPYSEHVLGKVYRNENALPGQRHEALLVVWQYPATSTVQLRVFRKTVAAISSKLKAAPETKVIASGIENDDPMLQSFETLKLTYAAVIGEAIGVPATAIHPDYKDFDEVVSDEDLDAQF